jgi:acylphosphatase
MSERGATPSVLTRLHATVSGRVQGVGFRMFVVDEAQRLDLTGWVRNCFDRTVEVTAEGRQVDLEELVRALHCGPPLARVQRVDIEWRDATGEYAEFEW